MLRIAMINDQRMPDDTATSEQVVNMAAAFGLQGVRVDLLAPRSPALPDPQQGKQNLLAAYGVADSFRVIPVSNPWPAHQVARKVAHGFAAPLVGGRQKYDLVYTRNIGAAATALVLGQRVVLDLYRLVNSHRRILVRCCRSPRLLGIAAHSELARTRLIEGGCPDGAIAVFHNGYNPDCLSPRLNLAEARQQLGWNPEAPIVVYTGRIDEDKAAPSILDLAARTPEIGYVLVGNSWGMPDGWLERQARQQGVTNLRCLPRVHPSQLAAYLYAASILLIPPSAAPLRDHGRTVLPLKTYLYLAAGRPVVAPSLPDLAEILTPDSAMLVQPDDPDGAARAIRTLVASPPLRERLSAGARSIASGLTWETRARRILDWIDRPGHRWDRPHA